MCIACVTSCEHSQGAKSICLNKEERIDLCLYLKISYCLVSGVFLQFSAITISLNIFLCNVVYFVLLGPHVLFMLHCFIV